MADQRILNKTWPTGDAPSPYHAAAAEWDGRIGSARVQARNWRYAALINGLVAAGAVAGLVVVATDTRTTVHIAEVDPTGRVVDVRLSDDRYTPTEAEIAHVLYTWVVNTRGKSIDPVVIRERWLNAYKFVGDTAQTRLSGWAATHDPFAQVGAQAIEIAIEAVLKGAGDSWQVRWVEKTFENGNLTAQERWSALLTVKIDVEAAKDFIVANPFGVFITDFSWQRELTATGAASAT